MKSKTAVVAMVLLSLLLAPLVSLRAQDLEGADLEVLEPSLVTDPAPTATATAAAWPVCQNGHWIRSSEGYPAVCTIEHIDDLIGQLTRIITAGVASGAFTASDPAAVARAVFHATGRFHDPGYFAVWERPGVDDDFAAVVALLLRGLRAD